MTPKAALFTKPVVAGLPIVGVLALGAATLALAYMFVKATENPARQPREGEYFG